MNFNTHFCVFKTCIVATRAYLGKTQLESDVVVKLIQNRPRVFENILWAVLLEQFSKGFVEPFYGTIYVGSFFVDWVFPASFSVNTLLNFGPQSAKLSTSGKGVFEMLEYLQTLYSGTFTG